MVPPGYLHTDSMLRKHLYAMSRMSKDIGRERELKNGNKSWQAGVGITAFDSWCVLSLLMFLEDIV